MRFINDCFVRYIAGKLLNFIFHKMPDFKYVEVVAKNILEITDTKQSLLYISYLIFA